MRKLTIISFLVAISIYGAAQTGGEINMITPTVLISGTYYQFAIPEATKSESYFVIADGKKAECSDGACTIFPLQSDREIYVIELYKVEKKDTSLFDRKEFEIMIMPDPLMNMGEYGSEFTITLHQDSLSKIRNISFTPPWSTHQIVTWERIKVTATINGSDKRYTFEGSELSDELITDLATLHEPTWVSFNVSLSGSDSWGRTVKYKRIIHSMTEDQYFRRYHPFHDLHLNKRVEYIGPGTFEKYDTITIQNPGDLYFHCIALGTENRYTFESLNNGEVIHVDVWSGGPKELLDFREKKGVFKVSLFGDGGSGEIIMIIE